MADDDSRYEEVAVLGHDDIWHNSRDDGTTICGMGRKSPMQYAARPGGCWFCIARVADGFRPMLFA